jgi:hypothetical protein
VSEEADEASFFSEDEFFAAYSRIVNPAKAKPLAREIRAPRSANDSGRPWQLAPDVLDLLSLVSDDCAERARAILGLSAEEAADRRARFAARFT